MACLANVFTRDQTLAHCSLATTPPRKRKRSVEDEIPEKVKQDMDKLSKSISKLGETFEITNKIGSGTFSAVYSAKLKAYPHVDTTFALKHLVPTSHPSRIESELRCLHTIGGCDNVMGVQLCLREKDNVVIVMPYFTHDKFSDYVYDMSVLEVREYMRNLFIALKRVHKFDIIHRDIKPSNFLYNRTLKKYALVDFGLAHRAPVPTARRYKSKVETCEASSSSPRKVKRAASLIENESQQSSDMTTSGKQHSRIIEPKLSERNPNTLTPNQKARRLNMNQKAFKSPKQTVAAKKAIIPAKTRFQTKQTVFGRQQAYTSRKVTKPVAQNTCNCYGQPQVCSMCLGRANQNAPRAGTPGFRAPEVLLKCPDQTTAVDMWSAGVIFLTLLTARYPFFRAPDDMTALAQIISIVGTQEMKAAAKKYGKDLQCSPIQPALDLKTMCQQLRGKYGNKTPEQLLIARKRKLQEEEASSRKPVRTSPRLRKSSQVKALDDELESWNKVPDSAYDLLKRLLDLNPHSRIRASEALQHPFIKGF
ncbi:cell division cycle 7-related protein kinase-like [Ptychodera flava]|uniref:cell division cycle 7-related protein kinase-like n=1 Tax=Ptychodera flava TaxID=63121 RepID=UPI003969F4C3